MIPRVSLLVISIALVATSPALGDVVGANLSYNRDIRPILSEACFHCHGFDKNTRKADLRLDQREAAVADRDGHAAIVPGKPDASELIKRILSSDPDEQMPPPKSARTLTPAQRLTLQKWISAGAKYEPHWAFVPPERPAMPALKVSKPMGAIDTLVQKQLDSKALTLRPEAPKATLLRRVSLDLTGIGPTPAETAAFLADDSPEAYEKVVDRLLASPRYGERMASLWIDAARYADTNGYQTDGPRHMWRWRDWVIDSFNANQPFDQFTIEQLAGDLLPNPTLAQRIATGFNRNHRTNSEGGIIPEEYRVEYVVDRVDTTATIWLGMTLGCARCHDHKYDPVTQREFYGLFAYFNNVPEQGKGVRENNSAPTILAPTLAMERRLAELDAKLAEAQKACADAEPVLDRALAEWERAWREGGKAPLQEPLARGLSVHLPFEDGRAQFPGGSEKQATGEDKLPPRVAGRVGQAAQFRGEAGWTAGDVGVLADSDKFTLAAWTQSEKDGGSILSRMDDELSFVGYDLRWENGRLQANLVGRILDDAIRVESTSTFPPGVWRHVAATYDGSKTAAGVRLYVDGAAVPVRILSDTLSNPIKTMQPLRVGSRRASGYFRGLIDDVRIYNREMEPAEIELLACPEPAHAIVSLAQEKRTGQQIKKLRQAFLDHEAPPAIQAVFARLTRSKQVRATFVETIPTTMVMQEMNPPRPTHVLVRGEYDKPGERVTPVVPAALPALPAGAPPNRLSLARWLVDPRHPLTARVTVNRFWQQLFGMGLVKTTEDFGSQGESPSHPELLDWLATEFIAQKWDVKRLLKTIVMSQTYRQSSSVTPELFYPDPDNRWLARGPRFRLPAEMIRDQALAASGLLVEKLGGPSTKPYQPEGLWLELSTGAVNYEQDRGENLYRRSLYTYWKRTVAPPSMMALDASSRDMCMVRQARTNTPLQALTLLNDVTFVETSRKLAERALREGGATPESRIRHAMRLLLAREPSPDELRVLSAGLARHRARFAKSAEQALKYVSVGESPRDESLDVIDLAAYTALAGVLLNLDETVTKE